jgi:PAS domain S-box-containing protein
VIAEGDLIAPRRCSLEPMGTTSKSNLHRRELPLVAFALALAVLIGGGLLGYYNVRHLVSNDRLVAHTDDAIVDLEAAYSALSDAESLQRSYLLTGDVSYLQPYQGAVAQMRYELVRLQSEFESEPAQQRRLLALKEKIEQKLSELNRTIVMNRAGDHSGALAMVVGSRWKGITHQVRGQVTAIQSAEHALLNRRAGESEASYRSTVSSLLAAAVIGVVLLGVIFYLSRRNLLLQRRATARIRSIVDNVVDGIVTMDEHGTIASVNPAAERLFGYAAQELLGENVRALMPETHRSAHDDYFAEYRRTGEAKVIGIGREVEGRRKDGSTFALELAVSEFEFGARRLFTAILRDITERKRIEQQKHDVMVALKETDRQKDEFLALVSHELRGPLAPLRNCLELLRLRGSDESLREKVQATMERQLDQLVRLVNDLLDLGRVARGEIEVHREAVELGSVMRHAVDACAPLVTAADHALNIAVPPEAIYVDADPARLTQVFSNLLQNACKYTEPGGRIEISAHRQAGQAVVRVKDTGVGIPPDKLDSIFGLFVRVSQAPGRTQGGFGIGLSVVKRLIELHGGSIEAFSAGLGTGSEFVVRIPLPSYLLSGPDAQRDPPAPGQFRS